MPRRIKITALFPACVLLFVGTCWGLVWAGQDDDAKAGPFGYALIKTTSGETAEADLYLANEVCATCHERQYQEFHGSMHSASHTDPIYRRFAEIAREEAGDEVYRYCSSCHAPAGVVSGLTLTTPEADLPEQIKQGVTCDTCHSIEKLTGTHEKWKEEGNASFVIDQGRIKYGASGQVVTNRLHAGEKREFFASSEFCASCHTVIHPGSGFRIEHTYGEWKKSIYAERGVQCQDCHMNSVEDAVKVAETMKPVERLGQSAKDGPERRIYPHYFVGANLEADRLSNGPAHQEMAEKRLKSAARLTLNVPEQVKPGKSLDCELAIENVAAGHNIPTGVTELRQMWVEVEVVDQQGQTLFQSGVLDESGALDDSAIWFGAVAVDAGGKKTHKLWEVAGFERFRSIAPKETVRESVSVALPNSVSGKLQVRARLRYRSFPPDVARQILKDPSFTPRIVDMAAAQANVVVK